MADSCCIVELKETIENMNAELSQSHTKISELDAKVREQEKCLLAAKKEMVKLQEENARLARDLKEENARLARELKEENAQLARDLKEENARLARDLKKENARLARDLKEGNARLARDLKEENAQLARNLKESEEKCRAIEERLELAEQKLAQFSLVQVNESNDDALDINSLPNEIILKIFGYLKQNQLGQIARVCKSWNVLVKSPVLWKKVNVKFFPSHRSQITKVESFINTLPSCVMSIRLDFSEYKDCILFDFREFCMELQKRCPHLVEINLCNSKLTPCLPSVIEVVSRFLQDVKKLVFHYCLFSGYFVQFGRTSRIEVLDLSWSIECFKKSPLFATMPSLKVLCLYRSGADDTWFEDDTSFFNQLHFLNLGGSDITARTFQAIQTHGLNLRELYLCSINLQNHDITFNKSLFPHLKTICVCCCNLTCESVVSIIQSCPSLQNVYVEEGMAKSLAKHPFVVANRCKSEIIKVVQRKHDHYVDYSYY